MLEPIAALIGFFVLWIAAILLDGLVEKGGFGQIFLYGLLGSAALYCLIRFVHWAWVTPFPFTSTHI